ncbi:MAG: cytochrome c [Actinomycetota bacterium]
MRRPLLLVGALLLLAASCSSGSVPEVPLGADGTADPVLVLGRDVYGEQCSRCHGADGGGRSGPRLNGDRMLERYPDPAEQLAVIANGRGGMPAFADDLTADELDAVVAYTREVLSGVG